MKPQVTILMVTSVDGRLHRSRFTSSPDGGRREWSTQYDKVHAQLGGDAWLVERVTISYGDGLAGKVSLQFKSVNALDHRIVDLCYTVLPAQA